MSAELLDELTDILSATTLADKTPDEIDELTKLLKANLEKVVQHGKRADYHRQEYAVAFTRRLGEWRSTDINVLVDESLSLAITALAPRNPTST